MICANGVHLDRGAHHEEQALSGAGQQRDQKRELLVSRCSSAIPGVPAIYPGLDLHKTVSLFLSTRNAFDVLFSELWIQLAALDELSEFWGAPGMVSVMPF